MEKQNKSSHCPKQSNNISPKILMKRLGYIILGVCLFLTSCREHGLRNHEEIREDAIDFVSDFVDDIYKGKDVSDKCALTMDACRMVDKIDQEFKLPYRLPDVIKATGVKIAPEKISYRKDVEEIRSNRKLDYVIVRGRYDGREIKFYVSFWSRNGKTGTEGEPLIWQTVGLVGFDNSSFSKKSGFTLEYDKSLPDLTPYILYTEAVAAQRFVAKHKSVPPNKVIIPKDIRENENPIWQVCCGDSVVYQVCFTHDTPKILNTVKMK